MDELRDENGFIKLTENDRIRDKNGGLKLKINGNLYYFKFEDDEYCYTELIAEELAKDYGISCAHYDIALFEVGGKVEISEDFIGDGTYIPISKILEHDDYGHTNPNHLNNIWNKLEQYKINGRNLTYEEIEYLMDKIVDIFMFDILIANNDRHDDNYGLLIKDDKVDIAPIFDNELMLSKFALYSDYFCLGIDESKSAVMDESNINYKFKMTNYFFQISSKEYLDRFKDKLWIISEDNLENVFKRVERRTKSTIDESIKNRIRNGFKINREKIDGILEELNAKKTMN